MFVRLMFRSVRVLCALTPFLDNDLILNPSQHLSALLPRPILRFEEVEGAQQIEPPLPHLNKCGFEYSNENP